jgi:integrase/recombinase XerC
MPAFQEALAAFQVQLQADGRSHHTRAQYARHLGLLASWAASERLSLLVEDLGHDDVARFLSSPAARRRPDGEPKRATSVNALRSSLRAFFWYVHAAGWTRSNPARLVRRAQTGTAPPRALTPAEEERLLAVLAVGSGRDPALFRLMLRTGMRLGSALALDASDVDLVEGVATIHAKGDRTERVFLPMETRAELAGLLDGRASGTVFASRAGKRLTTRHVQRLFARIRERAELPATVTCHSLRHTFGSRLLDRTGDIELVRRALTHRSVSSTQIYARCGDQRLRAALGA